MSAIEHLTKERDHALRAVEHAMHMIAHLKGLVARSFEEGFRARHPDEEEPWLVDWLTSKSRAELERLFSRAPQPDE